MKLHVNSVELDQVVGPERLPSWEDQKFLPYIQSLIKELHRCCGVGGLGKSSIAPDHMIVCTAGQQGLTGHGDRSPTCH